MSIVARKRAHGTTYYVIFQWQGKPVWERAGTDRREAERLERRRRSEVATGNYLPDSMTSATTVRQYALAWLDARTNRTAADDRARVTMHVLSRPWLADLPIEDVRPRHIKQLVEELKLIRSERTGEILSGKMVANIFAVLRTLFRDARIAEITREDPCVLPRGLFKQKAPAPRTPYSRADIRALTSDKVQPARRIWNTLAVYTGMREGEVCGRRWRDWDDETLPLGCLSVDTQYDDRPLKTDQPRRVPVHPELATALEWWWGEGFELVYCKRPTEDDFIVPHRGLGAQSRASGYEGWRRSCLEAGVTNLSLHSTRHSFISWARRGGARKEVLEKITHNAKGDIVDGYTTWDWAPLCDAVLCLRYLDENVDANVDAVRIPREKQWPLRGSNSGNTQEEPIILRNSVVRTTDDPPPESPRNHHVAADPAARQHRHSGYQSRAVIALEALLAGHPQAVQLAVELLADLAGVEAPIAAGEEEAS